jgi:hypothetical protein
MTNTPEHSLNPSLPLPGPSARLAAEEPPTPTDPAGTVVVSCDATPSTIRYPSCTADLWDHMTAGGHLTRDVKHFADWVADMSRGGLELGRAASEVETYALLDRSGVAYRVRVRALLDGVRWRIVAAGVLPRFLQVDPETVREAYLKESWPDRPALREVVEECVEGAPECAACGAPLGDDGEGNLTPTFWAEDTPGAFLCEIDVPEVRP